MKPIVIHPTSVLVGALVAVLGVVALGAQTPIVDGILSRGPAPMEAFYPPIPLGSLEFFPLLACASDATAQDVVAVHPGERLVPNTQAGGTPYVLQWPLVDSDGNGSFDATRVVGYSAFGVPTVLLGPGQYIFVRDFSVTCNGTPARDPDAVFAYRIRAR